MTFGLGSLGTLILIAVTMRRPGAPVLSMPANGWLFLFAFVLFVAVDLATGQVFTSSRDPKLAAGAFLLFLTVVMISLIIFVRRDRLHRRDATRDGDG